MSKHDDPEYWRNWYHEHKQKLNDQMLTTATNHRERWTQAEDDRLMSCDGSAAELEFVAAELGRSYMACQTRWYFKKNHPDQTPAPKARDNHTRTPTSQPKWSDDDDPNGWYVKG